ncbi:hypothetical protein N7532_010508 [Penicillium argentinense]|uniref:Mediator complex subunit 15 KIX domain-containing protein n=1 Tax=Penicillium argentinense TaxID=1131581 RepID=A0A9W9EPR3_9EURO|nr:uncharacterized protein N7532_010508 [Penicillium argentinense]KAJ5085737.1 hypothetical protein N7532_010508 [Penicillium argentinense]
MNPAQFPNPGGAMPGVVKPGMQPQQKEGANIIMGHVAQVLSNQGPFGGWKAEVPIKTRAMNVYQMITSLRLIQPRIDLQQAAQAALSFEQKAFQKATEKSDYEKECNEKLLHIKDTRQRQAAVALQSGMMPQAGAMQNQMQGGFPQMNRAMQSSPVPGQPQMSMGMGMNDPSQQQALMQRQQQQQSAMLQQQQQRPAQQRAGNAPLPDDLNNLSPMDLEQVIRLANQMLAKTSAEDMEKIKLNLSNMGPDQQKYLASKNMDPMTYFFRSQALNQLRRHKRAKEMAGMPNAGLDPNGAMMGDPATMNPQQRQMFQNMMNLQRNSAFAGNPGQGLDSNAFIGNVENIQGQQADGLRSQEAGQLVVPASSSQINQTPFPNNQNMFSQQMGQNGQANMNGAGVNPQMFNPQHMQQTGSNGPQDRMQFQNQQSQQAQAAQAQAQARAQAAQKAQMAMSGQNAQAQSHLGQGSPGMSTLNQPMAPGQMSPIQMPAQSRPPSRAPNMGQQPGGVQGGASQPGMQARPQIPPGVPQQIADQLSMMSNEQVQAYFANQRRTALANNMQRGNNPNQQPGGPQQTMGQPGQAQGMFNGQMGNNPRMRNSMSMPQGMAAGGPQQFPGGQQLTPQQRAMLQQQRSDMQKLALLRQQNNGIEMTPEQSKEMDRASFPASLLNQNSAVPKHIKTWGQLKQWAAANPQSATGIDMSKLLTLQKLHFGQILNVQQAKNSNGHGQGILTNPFQQTPQGQVPNAQNFQPGQPQPNGMPPMRPITANDIQVARAKLGDNAPQYTDEHIRDLLRSRQKAIIMHSVQQRAQAQAQLAGNMPPGQNQAMRQPHMSTSQNTQPVKPPTMGQPPQTSGIETPTSGAKPQAGPAGGKGPRATPAAAAAKQNQNQNPRKRPSTDETGAAVAAATTSVASSAQQPQPATTPANAPRPNMAFPNEQFATMNPQQRMQVEAHMRRQQQSQFRGPVLNRAAAEEAWNNNLPPKIMEYYNEISKNVPMSQPLPIPPDQKAAMTQLLRDSLDVLGRLDLLVMHAFGKMQGHEKNVRNLLAMRVQLMRQFKPSQEWIVNDQFTITRDYLTGSILFIRKLFQVMMVRMSQSRTNNGNQAQPNNQAAQANNNNNNTPLNASNLQQLQQQQEEALERTRRASSHSATHPPAPFGAPSPQGVPHVYGPGGLPPEKLKLPPPKKRKQSHTGGPSASPIQATATPTTAAKQKQAMADAKTAAPAAPVGAFKCSVVECPFHFQGFPTQAALDNHVEADHQPEEENIENPLEWYLDAVSSGLGLGKDGQPIKKYTPPAPLVPGPPPGMNKTKIASPGKNGLATPVTASSTPMARATSQLGAKGASPATPAQQLTPNQSTKNIPDPSPNKDAQKTPAQDKAQKDPWADCQFSLDAIQDAVTPVITECRRRRLGSDPFEEFMNADMFTQDQTEDTPDSFDAALATLTPDAKPEDDALPMVGFEPWDEASATATNEWMNLPEDLIIRDENDPTKPFEVDWDLVERRMKENNDEIVPAQPIIRTY